MQFCTSATPYPSYMVDGIGFFSRLKLIQTNVQLIYQIDTNLLMTVNTANMSFLDSVLQKFFVYYCCVQVQNVNVVLLENKLYFVVVCYHFCLYIMYLKCFKYFSLHCIFWGVCYGPGFV